MRPPIEVQAVRYRLEGEQMPLEEGQAVFVPAGAHHAFIGYEQLSVLVIFARR